MNPLLSFNSSYTPMPSSFRTETVERIAERIVQIGFTRERLIEMLSDASAFFLPAELIEPIADRVIELLI
jgi:hypothetical protein